MVEWGPAVALAALAGVIHLGSAAGQLDKACQRLIYLKPFRIPAVYLWAAVEFLLPAAICWTTLGLATDPALSAGKAAAAAGIGIGFTAVINGSTQLGGYAIDVRRIHEAIVKLVYAAIARRETSRTALFWQNLDLELKNRSAAEMTNGLRHLRHYASNDVSLDAATRVATVSAIDDAIQRPVAQQRAQIPDLLSVRRKDLAIALQQFGVSNDVISSLLARR